uniref:Uncharacterized protein n=1 Tax=Triticum urartu TaxID=4572 RepID=A0A8R7UNJ8_TRIUA
MGPVGSLRLWCCSSSMSTSPLGSLLRMDADTLSVRSPLPPPRTHGAVPGNSSQGTRLRFPPGARREAVAASPKSPDESEDGTMLHCSAAVAAPVRPSHRRARPLRLTAPRAGR